MSFFMSEIEWPERQIEVPEDLFVDMSEFEFSERTEYANSSITFGTRKHNGCETPVVLKEPNRLGTQGKSDPEKIYFLCDFVNEVVAQSKLKHPCILPVLGLKLFDKSGTFAPGIITPRMKASADELKEIDEEDAWIWGIGIADAMATVSEHGIMHRDLKPENIFLGEVLVTGGNEKENVKFIKWPFLGDFGYAAAIEEGDFCYYPFGTTGYKAPEMIPHDGYQAPYDATADVFSYGVTMWAITENKMCENGEKAEEQQTLLNSGEQLEFGTENGRQMKELMYECMSMDPDERPQFEDVVKGLKGLAKKLQKKNVARKVEMFVNALETEKQKKAKDSEEICIFPHDIGNEALHIVPFLETLLGRIFPATFQEQDRSQYYVTLSTFICSYLEKQPYAHGKNVKDLLVEFYNSERELLDLAQKESSGTMKCKMLGLRGSMPLRRKGMEQTKKPDESHVTVQPHFSWNNEKTELKISILRTHVRIQIPAIIKKVQFNFTPDKRSVVLVLDK